MKRTLLMLLAFAMMALAACGTPQSAPDPAPTDAQQSQAPDAPTDAPKEPAAPANAEPVKLTWVPQCDAPVDTSGPAVQEFFKRFNVEVEWIYLERSQITDLLQLRVSGGEIPDVMWINGNRGMYENFAKQGILAEIPVETLKEKCPNLYAGTNEICGEDNWELNLIDGKNYGVPTPFLENLYPNVPIIRDDWLKKVGLEVPTTLEEFEKVCYAFANDDPDGNGKKDTYAFSNTAMSIVYGAFGAIPTVSKWLLEGDEVVYAATMPGMFDALTYLAKWYKDGLIDPEFVTGENKGQYWGNTVSFWNGVIGISVPGAHYHSNPILDPNNPQDLGSTNYQQFKAIQGEDATYITMKPFTGPTGKAGSALAGTKGACNDLLMGVQCETDRVKYDKILELAEAQSSDFDTCVLVTKGIEGVDWKRSDDPKNLYISLLDPQEQHAAAKRGLDLNGMKMVRNNTQFANDMANQYSIEYREQFKDWPGHTNYVRIRLPSADDYEAQIEAARDEAYINFITGARPITPEEWQKFQQELDDLGLTQLTQEANEYKAKYGD